MADITYSSSAPLAGGRLRSSVRRGRQVLAASLAQLRWELAEQRRHYRTERALRNLDRHLLRDIGIDRDGC